MSQIVEKIYAECALNRGPRYVAEFFASQAQGDEGKIVIPLYAPLRIARFKADMQTPVRFVLSAPRTGDDMIPKIPLRWEPEGNGPFPAFEGTLSVEADDDYDGFEIVLRGSYEPPFGLAGKTFDAAVGKQIARATARELLERIRDFVEEAYQETELSKQPRG
jgi:hypothetical protein